MPHYNRFFLNKYIFRRNLRYTWTISDLWFTLKSCKHLLFTSLSIWMLTIHLHYKFLYNPDLKK